MRESKLAADVRKSSGVNVIECYQCGKCTAGCPMAGYMDIVPSRVMRLVQIGDADAEESLLRSMAIWACVSCLTCTQRCPKELDPAAVMDALREMSRRRGRIAPAARKIVAFHKAFLESVYSAGRMNEFPLVRNYKLASLDLFSDVMLAPLMLKRGKLHLKSKKIRGRGEIRRIFRDTAAREAKEHAQ